MYLAQLNITNFRKLKETKLCFRPGLNIIIGANNVGKTAIVDALRALLAGQDEPYPRFDITDLHCPRNGSPAGDIRFHYVFKGLDADDEADFLHALKPDAHGDFEVHITVRYSDADKAGRFRVKRWCGDHEDVSLTSDMTENLRGVYLPPLRDASQGLKPSRTSKLSRLFHLLTDNTGREDINAVLKEFDDKLKNRPPVISTHSEIDTRHCTMLGPLLRRLQPSCC